MDNPKKPHVELNPNAQQTVTPSNSGKHNESQASFVTRIGESASSLLQSSLSHPLPHAATNSLASLPALASKGESSSSSTDRHAPSASEAIGVAQSHNNSSHGSGASESFRSRPLDDGNRLQEDFDQWSMPSANDMQGNVALGSSSARNSNGKASTNAHVKENYHKQQGVMGSGDGAEVVSLLSDPAFNIDDDPPSAWDDNQANQAPQAVQADWMSLKYAINPGSLSQNELDAFMKQTPSMKQRSIKVYAANMTKAPASTLREKGALGAQRPRDHALDFLPELKSLYKTLTKRNLETNSEVDPRDRLRARIIYASDGSLQPWLDMLDRYQDEVWGDVLPVVQNAREEVGFPQESRSAEIQNHPNGLAVQRLKMILQHLAHSR